ncbi:deoxynucleoside kinase [Thermoflavifilum thermophilum]|uniref:Deoxyadenosine/deoxycytidine kinase n=1 Tax=Thermoflavifilum thermophilum TaxID=1393122 RepID=A0A1I7N1F0_9BACT|nr:deoxynucleoside kinase [Thermoflavifilum thermophilum]SFV28458.1 Deoxyadenosine/deoxycytidine kinase [Thermoflavifilum thermophilum]
MIYRFITIEGNIGAGKTTLAKMLGDRLKARLMLEQFADNPFLPKFYENPRQYAFPLELFFLAERYQQLKNMFAKPDLFAEVLVSDYLLMKSLLFARINLLDDEYHLFHRLFDIIHPQVPQPDLLIFLYAPVARLQQNIKKRNRSYEQHIPDEYLFKIQEMYVQFIRQQSLPTLMIDVSDADFEHEPEQFEQIVHALDYEYEPGVHYLSL